MVMTDKSEPLPNDAHGSLSADELFLMAAKLQGPDASKTDWARAIELLQRAAGMGHAKSQFRLGMAHFEGLGVVEDPSLAFEHLQAAARQGHTDAQFQLA